MVSCWLSQEAATERALLAHNGKEDTHLTDHSGNVQLCIVFSQPLPVSSSSPLPNGEPSPPTVPHPCRPPYQNMRSSSTPLENPASPVLNVDERQGTSSITINTPKGGVILATGESLLLMFWAYFNFLIGEDGYVYEGRGWRSEGAHTYGYNDLSLGFAFIGTFTERPPNEAAWKALKCLLDFGVKIGYLASDYLIVAHSDISDLTSPGDPVLREIATWPNYKHN
ncbi:hypothetical protein JRQ81_009286 [Phrynocephalus forsythii]|uniref:Peptidoglycan recognition protein family domain-containing protein n=1 Tax=Phrynocephalus forsythii TaxID=171643 RepID=A0A9Q1ARS7_9SAUR|nr:hypothetical protein JRQ81_009286 [Phrynocephalus forsythii]